MKTNDKRPPLAAAAALLIMAWLPLAGWTNAQTAPVPPAVTPVATPAPPADTATLAKIAQAPPIVLRERYVIVNRQAKFIKHPNESRWFLAFESSHIRSVLDSPVNTETLLAPVDTQPEPVFDLIVEVLPCKWLTAMNFVCDRKDDLSLTFRVWGTIHEYKGRNHILPTLVATEKLFDLAERPALTDPGRMNGLEALTQTGQPARPLEQQRLAEQQRLEALTGQLRQQLLLLPRPDPLELPPYLNETQDTPGSTPPDPAQTSDTADTTLPSRKWKDGQVVMDREGRLQLNVQTGQFLFLFDSDGQFMGMPPVILHPCRLLEEMETKAAGTLHPLRFRISGTTVKFQGKDYLLLLKMMSLENERRTLSR